VLIIFVQCYCINHLGTQKISTERLNTALIHLHSYLLQDRIWKVSRHQTVSDSLTPLCSCENVTGINFAIRCTLIPLIFIYAILRNISEVNTPYFINNILHIYFSTWPDVFGNIQIYYRR
jgi:hypothetical protein